MEKYYNVMVDEIFRRVFRVKADNPEDAKEKVADLLLILEDDTNVAPPEYCYTSDQEEWKAEEDDDPDDNRDDYGDNKS